MTIFSMTGFARVLQTTPIGTFEWEVRSVNHRYFETFFRLPELFRSLEMELRMRLQQSLKRGKIDVVLQFTPNDATIKSVVVNDTVLRSLCDAIMQVQQLMPNVNTNVMDVLRWNGVMKSQTISTAEMSELFFLYFEKVVAQLLSVRQREGQALQKILLDQCELILSEINKIKDRFSQVIVHERTRILDRFQELALSVDHDRLEQEMMWLIQKSDIKEELQRIRVHVDEVRRVLKEGGSVGRRLDFLMQELNREVNTIASKSIDAETTQSTVEMKVGIEQMREQVQNIE